MKLISFQVTTIGNHVLIQSLPQPWAMGSCGEQLPTVPTVPTAQSSEARQRQGHLLTWNNMEHLVLPLCHQRPQTPIRTVLKKKITLHHDSISGTETSNQRITKRHTMMCSQATAGHFVCELPTTFVSGVYTATLALKIPRKIHEDW